MARFIIKHKKDIGISPDELFFRGERKIDNVLLRVIDYNAEQLEEHVLESVIEIAAYIQKPSVTWFNIDGLHNTTIMQDIATLFSFDPIIMADVMNIDARPRLQEYDEHYLLISLKMMQYEEKTRVVTVENLSVIITDSVLLSFQERKGDVFEAIRVRIRKNKKRIRYSGTDYLLFAILDVIVDNYSYVISILGEEIETLEELILNDPKQEILEDINRYKRELNFIKKNIKPAHEIILQLSKIEYDFIDDSTNVHFKELLDNINHVIETAESYREILSDQLNIYHSTISSRLNDTMKFLTIFSVIFIPLTFIAGIYGTNFDIMPELHYKYSYFIMLGVMLLLALTMIVYFRKKKWL